MLISQSKWPQHLRMPSGELQHSPAAPFGVSSVFLKRHKTLPHPREDRVSDILPYYSPPVSKPRVLSVDTGIPSSPTSQSSSPRTLKHASKRIGVPDLPPTPPTHSRQSSSGNTVIEHIISREDDTKTTPIPTTPTNQQSPPTPDVTPPRATSRPLISRPPLTERYPSSGYPSSRNDSFKTARENFSSDDEDEASTVRPILPSAVPSQVDVPQTTSKPLRSREVGLGLGLESDNEGTPRPEKSKTNGYFSRSKNPNDFGTFDGEWGSSGEMSEVEREWDHNLMRNVTVRRRPAREPYLYQDNSAGEVLNDNPVTPTNATRLLRKYPILESLNSQENQVELTPGTPTRRAAAWPAASDTESPIPSDLRRFSAMSTRSVTSAVVEAMVVDTPPQRRKTLRHSKKQFGLRQFSADQSIQSLARDSTSSGQGPHRLVHKTSGIFSRKHQSLSSAITTSTSSSARSRRELWANGSIPVVVVPERRSSSKSARTPSLRSTSSRRTKRSMSLNSAPLSHSSKANDPGYFDIPKRNPRRLSESAGSSGAHSQRTIDFPPTIPARRSSLSAPTSRNTSRAGSLTTESLRAHNMIQAQAEVAKAHAFVKPPSPEPPKDSTHHATRASVDHNGDPFFGNRLSAQVTPFSQASYETTGTSAELAQATSVALYPHHNESVLMVEQQPQQVTAGQASTIADAMKTLDPVTPPQQQFQQEDDIDSPLKNPRDAPQPPAIKFIPPTPNVQTPAQEEERQLGMEEQPRPSTADQKPKRGLSLIRRALSNRRHSESIISRTFSTKRNRDRVDESTQTSREIANPSTVYPSVIDQPADESKLHPFWRPARFWDDLEDDDEAFYTDRDPYPPVDNRPNLPKRSISDSFKRTFAILPIRDDTHQITHLTERRVVQRTGSGTLRVVKNRGSNDSLRRALSNGRSYYTSVSHTAPHENELERAWAGFKGLGRRMSEKRRERRNEKLRKTISGPKDAVDGVARIIASDGMAGMRSNGNVIRRKPVPQRGLDTVPSET